MFVDTNGNGILDAGETRLANVTIQLIGTDDLGRTVSLTTTTDSNGFYHFGSLRAGTYSILETQPAGFDDGPDYVGTVNGTTDGSLDNDRLFDISLATNQNGVNYDFTELSGVGLPG